MSWCVPRAAGMEIIEQVFSTGRPAISKLFTGATAGHIVTVGAPVTRHGEVQYMSQYSFAVERFQHLLNEQKISEGWIATLLDRNHLTIARNRHPDRWLSKPLSVTLAPLLHRASEGVGRGTSREDIELFFAWDTSAESGWRVAVGAPVELVNAPMRRMLLVFAIAAFCVFAGIAAALIIGRRMSKQITESVNRISDAAIAIGQGAPVTFQGPKVSEIDAARESLAWACETVQHRTAELERARQEAVAANQAKDEFIATLAHEVRTPLSTISTATHVIERSQPMASRETAIIRRQVKHLTTLVNDLVDADRVAMNKFVLVPRPMDLVDAVCQSVETLGSGKDGVDFAVNAPGEVWIDGDETRIHQVISNLLMNAVKFTPKGGEISVTVKRVGTDALLEVKDTGIGIPNNLIPRVFDLFVQGERVDGVASGMGIGLALVRRLVELHGGTVSVWSEGRNRGSTFTVTLPSIDASASIAA